MSNDALSRYKRLKKEATELREWANPNCTAGPTFWGELKDDVGAAIAAGGGQPENGFPKRISKEQFFAVGYVAPIREVLLHGADRLDADAEQMLGDLRKQSAEIAELILSLETAHAR